MTQAWLVVTLTVDGILLTALHACFSDTPNNISCFCHIDVWKKNDNMLNDAFASGNIPVAISGYNETFACPYRAICSSDVCT